ncbi:MAG: HupE/UreJ family protein [Verrucomicrobia bacterium]|nr:HupE/UreJ family protein [Verrucomicrobiota bacterium]
MSFNPDRRRLSLAIAGVAWLTLPVEAHAHSPFPGAGDFIGGLLHPVTSPTHILVIIGLGLMAGRNKLAELKEPAIVFTIAAGLGLLLTTTGMIVAVPPAIPVVIALICGAALALEKRLPTVLSTILFAAGALTLGLDSAVENGSTATIIKTLLGNWISLVLLVVDLAIYVTFVGDAKWLKIAIRIVGSWIIAIALMVLAFSMRPAS